MVLALAVVIQEPQIALFVIGALYVASGPVEWAWRVLSGRPLEELPPPAAPETPAETAP